MSDKFFFQDERGQGFEYYILKKEGSKSIRLTVEKSGLVRVTIPKSSWYFVTEDRILDFLKEQSSFIQEVIKKYKKKAQKFPDLFESSNEHYRRYRKQAQELVKSKVDYYCRRYGFKYNRISIRNQASRWGSCSSLGNLNFNYKVLFLAPEEQNYIVVHELCHLKEQNHSKNFWQLVENILPNYKEIHKVIRNKNLL